MTPLVPLVEWTSFRVGLLKSQKRWHSNCKGMVIKGKVSTIVLWSILRGSMKKKKNVEILNFHDPKWLWNPRYEVKYSNFWPVNHLCFGVLWGHFLGERLSPYKPGPSQFPFNQVWTIQPLKNQWGMWFMENSHVCLVLFVRPTCCKKPILASEYIRIPWFIRAGYKNVLPGFSWTCFCWRFVTDCTGTKTTMKPPFWENSFGTLSKALPSTTATLHCLGGFEATNGQAMPSCTAAGAGKDCLTVCVEDGFSFGKAGFGECT